MSNFKRARGALASLALTVGAASLLAIGTATAPSLALAQSTNPAATEAPQGDSHVAAATRHGPIDQRIDRLRSQLKITSTEESDWDAVAQAMRENASDMQQLVTQVKAEVPRDRRTALQDLQIYRRFADAHAVGLKRLSSAFATLYNAMPPEQQRTADEVFRSFEHHRPSRRG